MLEAADRDRIAGAVQTAEAATSAEIVCVLTRRVSTYPETAIGWGAAAALLLPPLALALGFDPQLPARIAAGATGWTAAAAGEADRLGPALGAYALVQAVVFALAAGLAALPALRVRLTPPSVKSRRVREVALGHLARAMLAAGPSRAAVVIFAADDEHRVEVLASDAAHAAVGQATWDEAMAAMLQALRRDDPTTGFVRAAEICGEALARHFPQTGPDGNALPNPPLVL